jgi:hypothetical protein
MGFNYNGKLRCGELLLRPDGSVVRIRRSETLDDYFATLDSTPWRRSRPEGALHDQRNPGFSNLTAGYLFPEIARRRREYLAAHPDAKLISLGIGNTTEPLTPHIDAGLVEYSRRLATKEGYSGYGDEQGLTALRERIAAVFYGGKIAPEEVFVSDGAKCDIGRLQLLFGRDVEVAVQDPSYPVYVDGSVIIGAAGAYDAGGRAAVPAMPASAICPAPPRTAISPICPSCPRTGWCISALRTIPPAQWRPKTSWRPSWKRLSRRAR